MMAGRAGHGQGWARGGVLGLFLTSWCRQAGQYQAVLEGANGRDRPVAQPLLTDGAGAGRADETASSNAGVRYPSAPQTGPTEVHARVRCGCCPIATRLNVAP
jgi:hypothetical protein